MFESWQSRLQRFGPLMLHAAAMTSQAAIFVRGMVKTNNRLRSTAQKDKEEHAGMVADLKFQLAGAESAHAVAEKELQGLITSQGNSSL